MIQPYLASIKQNLATRPHGTRHRYLAGCRCVPCRAANSRYSSECDARKRAGEGNPFVSAAAARKWILGLQKRGLGRHTVAAAADVPASVILAIRKGVRLHIRAATECRILAVDPGVALADGAIVSAGKTWRLLDELIESGYSKTWLTEGFAIARQIHSVDAQFSLEQLDRDPFLWVEAGDERYCIFAWDERGFVPGNF